MAHGSPTPPGGDFEPTPGADSAPTPTPGLSPKAIVRILGVGAILLTLLSMPCVYGDWHEIKGRRVIGSPAGDCAGKPCMGWTSYQRTCRGTEHVGAAPFFIGGLIIALQLLVLATGRRGLAIGLTIAQLPIIAASALLPILTDLDHLFGDSGLASSGSLFISLNVLVGLLVAAQLTLTLRKAPGAPPAGA